MIRTVIFDFDGTLADTSEGIVRTMQATLRKMGLPVTDEFTIRQAIGLPLAGSVSVGGHVPDDRVDEGVRTYRRKPRSGQAPHEPARPYSRQDDRHP